ncbi:hypothetical protein CCUS01_16105 [Colletotrichum cuscutae]|uniref:Uncharacterized protein n=1 Tax=Colletotrichum cuscutae TaxID=1209917 RepID=A0AAI9VDA2_9PEZI|nr:hypothetical protein CCUS01_16105 [Colletotrichum cuscutae]
MCSVKDPEMQCDSGPTRSPPSGRGIWWSRWKYAEGGSTHGARSTAPHAAWETLEEFWGWDVNIALDNWHRHVRPSRRRKNSAETTSPIPDGRHLLHKSFGVNATFTYTGGRHGSISSSLTIVQPLKFDEQKTLRQGTFDVT